MDKFQTQILQALYDSLHDANEDSEGCIISADVYNDIEADLGSFLGKYGFEEN